MTLSRDDILKTNDLTMKEVDVPEWGGSIFLRTMSGAERDAFEQSCFEGRGKDRRFNYQNVRARFLAYCIADENGNRLFTDADITELGKKSSLVLSRLFEIAQEMNGFTESDIEELTKNSETGQSDSSISG